MSDESATETAADQVPVWAAALVDNVDYLVVRLSDLEDQLRDINQQLQTIGDVNEFGHPL